MAFALSLIALLITVLNYSSCTGAGGAGQCAADRKRTASRRHQRRSAANPVGPCRSPGRPASFAAQSAPSAAPGQEEDAMNSFVLFRRSHRQVRSEKSIKKATAWVFWDRVSASKAKQGQSCTFFCFSSSFCHCDTSHSARSPASSLVGDGITEGGRGVLAAASFFFAASSSQCRPVRAVERDGN